MQFSFASTGSHLISLLQNTPPASATERLAATALRKETDKYRGCDWIQELSITIRRTKKVRPLQGQVSQCSGFLLFQCYLLSLFFYFEVKSDAPFICWLLTVCSNDRMIALDLFCIVPLSPRNCFVFLTLSYSV